MDIAALGLKIEDDGLIEGTRSLDSFADASDKAGKSSERVGKDSRKASDGVKKLGSSARNASGGMNSFTRSIVKMTGALAAALSFQKIISTVANYEKAMSGVAAVTRATTAEIVELGATAKRLGATTEFSAAQAAEGLRFLGMAGFSAAESIKTLPNVLNLATASGIALGSAADITSNIMSGFGIAAAKSASVVDVLAAAASRANTDIPQLGAAMSVIAPVSKALEISLGDTAAAIGTLSDAGIQGERAGTPAPSGGYSSGSSSSTDSGSASEIRALRAEVREMGARQARILAHIDTLLTRVVDVDALRVTGDSDAPVYTKEVS